MKVTSLITILAAILLSCSTTKKSNLQGDIAGLNELNPGLQNFVLKANLNISVPDFQNSAVTELQVGGYDSLLMLINAPIGLPIAKLYSNQSIFEMYSIFENILYEGEVSDKGFAGVLSFPVSLDEFIGLIKCQPFSKADEYEIEKVYSENSNVLFKKSKAEYIDYILYSPSESAIVQYQRKKMDGTLIINCSYNDYNDFGGIRYAKKINANFPEAKSSISLTTNSIEMKKKFDKPFRFSVPSSVEKRKY